MLGLVKNHSGVKASVKAITGFISNHPCASLYARGFVTSIAGVHTYMKSETKALELAIFKELEKGIYPPTNNAMVAYQQRHGA